MTTIGQLTSAYAVADGDLVPVWHGAVTYKATRGQIVAGLQPALALGQGTLLGRASAGTGAPETVRLGANLSMTGAVLSAAASPLDVPALPAGTPPAAADLVPLAQAGRTVAVSYARLLGDAVPVEAFGATGDGTHDDTAAFAAALAAGVPLRLGARTYVLNGQFTIARPGTVLLGVPGVSVLRRGAQSGTGAWISIQADGFRADGVVFDANGPAVAVESWAVLVTAACTAADFHRCTFRNAYGATRGAGLVLLASDPAPSQHVIRDCTFHDNAAHGLWIQAVGGVQVSDCRAHDNAGYGIVADFNDARFIRKARLGQIRGNRAWGNTRGIAIGNFNATNAEPPTWGNANPDAVAVLVQGNTCHDNTIYGIAAAGQSLAIIGNVLSANGNGVTGGAGILANVSASLIADNVITGNATYGIDSGGSQRIDLRGNTITGGRYGLNCGGSIAVRAENNAVQDCTVAGICVANVETDGAGVCFNQATAQVSIAGNWIGMDGTAAGIWLRDGPQDVMVARNHFAGTSAIGNCLWADTDSVIVEANRYNFAPRLTAGPTPLDPGQIVVPDIADHIALDPVASPVTRLVSARQAQQSGKISFIRITAPGTGYTAATLAIGGSGQGATAQAVISNGGLIGAVVLTAGSGYGAPGTRVPVSITGDGTGAAAIAWAGPPLPENRRLHLHCTGTTTLQTGPTLQSWTGTSLTLPAGSDITLTAIANTWHATRIPAATHLSGPARLTTQGEPTGCTSLIGRGSPEGSIAAAPGSDYRNLDGGAGNTWFIKQTGTGPTGWFAIA